MASDQYWNRNIDEWGKFYLGISHSGEELTGPKWFAQAYKASVGRHEAQLMKERYRYTLEFIQRRVSPGMRVVDVGCGTGIFALAMLRQGAEVVAVDYAPRALDLTRQLVKDQSPDLLPNLRLIQADVAKDPIPECDAFLAVGLTPYLVSIDSFFAHVVSRSGGGFVSLLDASHWANRLRQTLPLLNVRRLNFPKREVVDDGWKEYGFHVVWERRLGTGFLQEVVRSASSPLEPLK